MPVEQGDRQFRALDVGVVTEARERDRWDAQPGKLLICVHWVVLAARAPWNPAHPARQPDRNADHGQETAQDTQPQVTQPRSRKMQAR
jgi:hypothetical protein